VRSKEPGRTTQAPPSREKPTVLSSNRLETFLGADKNMEFARLHNRSQKERKKERKKKRKKERKKERKKKQDRPCTEEKAKNRNRK